MWSKNVFGNIVTLNIHKDIGDVLRHVINRKGTYKAFKCMLFNRGWINTDLISRDQGAYLNAHPNSGNWSIICIDSSGAARRENSSLDDTSTKFGIKVPLDDF